MAYPTIGNRLDPTKFERLLTAAALHAAKMEAGDSIIFDKLHLHPLAQNAYDIMTEQMRRCPLEALRVFELMENARYEYDDILEMPKGIDPPADTSIEENGRFLAECLYQASKHAAVQSKPQLLRVKPEERTTILLGIATQLYDENGIPGKKVGFRERREVERTAKRDFDTHMTRHYLKEQSDYRKELLERGKAFGFERRSPMLAEIKRINRLADRTHAGLVKNGRRLAAFEARMAAGHELSKRDAKSMLTCLQSMNRLEIGYREAMNARGADLRSYLTNFGDGLEHSFRQFCNELIRQTELRDPIAVYAESQTRGDLLGTENSYDLQNPLRLETPEDSRFRAAQDKAYAERGLQPEAPVEEEDIVESEDIIESDDSSVLFEDELFDSELSDDVTPPPPTVVLGDAIRKPISLDLDRGVRRETGTLTEEKERPSITVFELEDSDLSEDESELSDSL